MVLVCRSYQTISWQYTRLWNLFHFPLKSLNIYPSLLTNLIVKFTGCWSLKNNLHLSDTTFTSSPSSERLQRRDGGITSMEIHHLPERNAESDQKKAKFHLPNCTLKPNSIFGGKQRGMTLTNLKTWCYFENYHWPKPVCAVILNVLDNVPTWRECNMLKWTSFWSADTSMRYIKPF